MKTEKKKLELKSYKKTGFEKRIEGVKFDPSMSMLPLIHKADTVARPGRTDPIAQDYFAGGAIPPVPCDVFGENLIYTYVGRPAFRELRCPICFILYPAAELLQNLFIFDTGAYYTNRYRKIVDNAIDVNHFRIPADADCIRRFITLHFGNNESYFFGRPEKLRKVSVQRSVEEFEYLVLENLIRFNGLRFDTRCRTLENILRTPISLEKYLQAVIMPESQSANGAFTAFCERTGGGFDIMYYNDDQGEATATTCNSRLEKVLYNYYVEKGYVGP